MEPKQHRLIVQLINGKGFERTKFSNKEDALKVARDIMINGYETGTILPVEFYPVQWISMVRVEEIKEPE